MTNTSSTAATTTMRACALDEFNAPGSVRDVPIPLAGEGEVLVRVRAAGVNPFDAAVMAGLTQTMMEHRFPLVPGVDAAGAVEAVGPGETEFAVGDEVFGQFLKPVAGEGTYADYVVVTAGGMIAHKPAAIDFAQAAALGTPALAALESVNALAPQEMQAALAAKVFALPDVEDRPTTLSAPGARAIWLKDSVPASPNDAFLGHREIGHFHPWDGSLHIVLPPDLAREVVAAGWAEVHPVARAGAVPPNRVMLYGPRDGQELEIIFGLMDQFADGVTLFDLAAIRASDLVLSTMARALGLRDSGPQPPLERRREYLRDWDMLLILDNFEQVLPAAGHLADLLAAAPGLRMLVTSRVPLRLRSEQILRIYPLPVPEPDTVVPVDQLVQIPSVALFVERAQESLLSEREQEVLRLVAEGLTSKVIGQQIFLSHRTVDHHLTSIFNKLGVDTRAQAVAVAAREGPL